MLAFAIICIILLGFAFLTFSAVVINDHSSSFGERIMGVCAAAGVLVTPIVYIAMTMAR